MTLSRHQDSLVRDLDESIVAAAMLAQVVVSGKKEWCHLVIPFHAYHKRGSAAKLRFMEQDTSDGRTASSGVDVTKLIGKPDLYNGGEDKAAFDKWSFIVAAYIAAMSAELGEWMTIAGEHHEPIVLAAIGSDKIRTGALQLYHILTMLCRNAALKTVMGVESGNGYEAWRKLKKETGRRTTRRTVEG